WLHDVQQWRGASTRPPAWARIQEIDLRPGQTSKVVAATQGRTVIGRIEPGEGLVSADDAVTLDRQLQRGLNPEDYKATERPQIPTEFDTAELRAKWYLDWFENTETGRKRKIQISRFRAVMICSDGTFIAQMVEPGRYILSGSLRGTNRDVASLDP